jgi:hypothetical protein
VVPRISQGRRSRLPQSRAAGIQHFNCSQRRNTTTEDTDQKARRITGIAAISSCSSCAPSVAIRVIRGDPILLQPQFSTPPSQRRRNTTTDGTDDTDQKARRITGVAGPSSYPSCPPSVAIRVIRGDPILLQPHFGPPSSQRRRNTTTDGTEDTDQKADQNHRRCRTIFLSLLSPIRDHP